MPKTKIYYKCNKCGFKTPNWMGRCTNCGTWNSFTETKGPVRTRNEESNSNQPNPITRVVSEDRTRFPSGIEELDRVLGGGIVSGSLILLGGAPGIGKSTLILQVAFLFSKSFSRVLYISGEESTRQIKMRAERLNALDKNLFVLGETEFNRIREIVDNNEYQLVVIDSVQTIYDSKLDSAPGSISQIKGITGELLKIAKEKQIIIFLIGHVTKEGSLAGPRVLEHLVDTVLQFEGDRNYSYRILRAIKNRFGSTNEIGVFEMKESGMEEIPDPSRLFLQERPEDSSGSVIVPVIEGSRTILVEVQALVSTAAYAAPQRLTTGISRKRVSILMAVLEKKVGFNFQALDAHLNIVGGLKVDEPALDLGIVTAIVSSYRDISLPSDLAVCGEIGLAGEIRAINQIEKRIKELKKMGFKEILIPAGNLKKLDFDPEINLKGVKDIKEVIDLLFLERGV